MKPFDIKPRVTMEELLGNSREYVVPDFQRDYSWDNEHWEELWEDIERMGEGEQHYMGYIVLQGVSDSRTRHVIIDGQQRIATLSIFAKAAVWVLQDPDLREPDRADVLFQSTAVGGNSGEVALQGSRQQRGELISRFLTWDDPVTLKPRIRLTLNGENDAFYRDHIMRLRQPVSPSRVSRSNRRMWNALKFFREKLLKRFGESPAGEELARLLSDKVANGLFFTEMRVADAETAYTIFETLNARGATLSSPDLLKNFLFSVVEEGGKEDIRRLKRQWGGMLRALGRKNDSTIFMRHLWHSMGGEFARKKDLFKVMRREIEGGEAGAAFEFMDKLEEGAEIYADIRAPDSSTWDKKQLHYLRDLKAYGVSSHLPLTLAAYRKWNRTDDYVKLLKLCVALSFRRTIIGGQVANELERVYAEAAADVHCSGASVTDVRDRLRDADVSDDFFANAFAVFIAESGKSKNLAKHILLEIETRMGDGKRQRKPRFDPDDPNITIEHILPEEPGEGWGDFDSSDNIDRFIWRLGNLTLLTKSDNGKCGNLSFAKKRKIYGDSGFLLTKDLVKYEEWTPENIEHRQREFAKHAKALWRLE